MKIKKFSSKILVTKEWVKDAIIKHDQILKEMKKCFKKDRKQ